jgi:hypothetical protein
MCASLPFSTTTAIAGKSQNRENFAIKNPEEGEGEFAVEIHIKLN